jgi:hypothetical protein
LRPESQQQQQQQQQQEKRKRKQNEPPLAPASRLQRTLPVAVGRLFILAMIVNLRELKYTVPK